MVVRKRANKKRVKKEIRIENRKNNLSNFIKSYWFILALLVVLIIILILLKTPATGYAINPENTEDPLGIGLNPNTMGQSPEEFQAQSTNYLKQEWLNLLGNAKYGWIFTGIRDVLIQLNFFWNPVLGMDYSFSWLFIFAFSIWLVLFFIISDLIVFISDKKLIRVIAAFCIASLVGLSGVIKKAADLLGFVVTNTWIAWICLGITILIMILLVQLGGGFKAYMKKLHKQQDEDQLKRDKQIIDKDAKVAEEELKSY